ncbi:MAG: UDP-N-acetylglucosamine 2-epimerase (non-hydrolyzing) [Clostridia bacterium]|nr:UDP-N-acetylglucosamine 2-epimerase (non-hydrolyzing) [Clostridia bacterium]
MKKLKVMTVFGTRPEAIKMAPLVLELEKNPNTESIVCLTAQHRQMLDMVMDMFKIKADYDLNIMRERQTLSGITTLALNGLDEVMKEAQPDIVLVHGDTSTTFAGSLAAFYNQIKVGHVEAGLRTYDKYSPFPEEMNRKLTGAIADIHFSPTISNKNNLLKESVDENTIYITGNTVIDATKYTVSDSYVFKNEEIRKTNFESRRVILVTAHRRENLGEPLKNICNAVRALADKYEDVEIIYPVHLNPAVRETVFSILGNHDRIHLIDPVDVDELHNLMKRCYMVMTDSGGLQEEAPALGKPVLVLRTETERPEAIAAGTAKLAGCDEKVILDMASTLLSDKSAYDEMAHAANPYGDGTASERIVNCLLHYFGYSAERPEDFTV